MENKSFRTLGLIILIIGAILLAFLGIISMWGDLEAMVFHSAVRSKENLSTLRCPAVITPQDDASVSARIDNPSDRELEMRLRTYVSDGYVIMLKEILTNFMLGPGESREVQIPISMEDAAYDRVVLVRMKQISRGPLPSADASCGVIVFDIPYITGSQFVIIILCLGILFGVGGLILWGINAKPIIGDQWKTFRLLIFFVTLSIFISISGLLGWWGLTLLLVVVWVLLGIGLIGQYALASRKKQELNDLP